MYDQNEENKIQWIIGNTILNGLGAQSCGEEYDYWNEAMLWAKGESYFPKMSEEEFLAMARQYEFWNEFEKTCKE